MSRIDNIQLSHSKSGWDSDMVYSPSVVQVKNKLYMFYCGNNFGQEGLGVAQILI